MIVDLEAIADDSAFDLVAVGAGAGGMAAALFAAIEGKKILLVERAEFVGGTTALSAGTTWIPNTRHSAPGSDDFANAARYLEGVVGNHSSASLREAFLRSGPEAIDVLEDNSEVKFRACALHPDYEQQFAGATLRGRALEPVPFDGRRLGRALDRLRPPIPEFTIFGGMAVDRTDIGHLLNVRKSLASLRYALRILGRYACDRLYGSRSTRLVLGNALIGRFLVSLEQRGASIVVNTSVESLVTENDRVVGLVLKSGQARRRVRAAAGVVLATGGFGRHPRRRAEMLPQPAPEFSPAAPGPTGELQDLAIALGARFGVTNLDNAFWAPVSVRRREDSSIAVFPHFVLDRSKPGTVCVNQAGKRFVNECSSYHVFGRAMFESNNASPCIPCYIVTDAAGLQKYGLGMVRMHTRNLTPYLQDGYLVQGATIAELAHKIAIPPEALERTIASMNTYARTGIDPEFGRGTTAYHRVNGDATHEPNPTLGPIAQPPFYAVRLYPSDIGAATGLVIDEWARVLNAENAPIPGLYACGNEANSIMGGTYPGPGITIGPAIVFAYRAVQNALGKVDAAPTRAASA